VKSININAKLCKIWLGFERQGALVTKM